MATVRVYLKTGGYFDVEADIVRCKRNNAGELVHFSCEGTSTGLPLYLDLNQVAAVVQATIEGDDDCDKET